MCTGSGSGGGERRLTSEAQAFGRKMLTTYAYDRWKDHSDGAPVIEMFKDGTSGWQGCAVFLQLGDGLAYSHSESGMAESWLEAGGRVIPYFAE